MPTELLLYVGRSFQGMECAPAHNQGVERPFGTVVLTPLKSALCPFAEVPHGCVLEGSRHVRYALRAELLYPAHSSDFTHDLALQPRETKYPGKNKCESHIASVFKHVSSEKQEAPELEFQRGG
jgi:hypothetical protein